MAPVQLAVFWHQHQPYYPDRVGGENPMPWVRLHGIKDYWGMAAHIREVPEFRCTMNLVPSLLEQIELYTHHQGSDRHLDLTRMPADSLSETDAIAILDQFFMANLDSMIRPFPRYWELYQKRGPFHEPAERALRRFSERDLRDLQVWGNLTWMHPLLFETDVDLQRFRQKGQNWSESEKVWLIERQLDVLRQVIPMHRELMEGGQLEITTTPYYHPIMPLLWDKRCARQAMPGCQLPRYLDSYSEDVHDQLMRAVKQYERLFGRKPRGMWPSEGSVSQDIIPAIADAGIEWIATDEEILSASTNGWVARDGNGFLRHPEMLYRPWRLEEKGRSLQIIFRDHALSDLIGFQYQRVDASHAADDILGKVEAIGRAIESAGSARPALVPIILDGENCWEYYPDGGVAFLRKFYRGCVQRPQIQPVTVSDSLDRAPASDRISQLFAGSWISHNFAIWIGHQEDREAWDLLHQTREFLKQAKASGNHSTEVIGRASDEIAIAEGSDWFWWYGDDHSSAQDALFDHLFRKHLKNVYLLLDVPYPPVLDRPIAKGAERTIHTLPEGHLRVRIDGMSHYFEWINAGEYVSGSERGTMAMVSGGEIAKICFGFDPERFLVRIDAEGNAKSQWADASEIRISFAEPADVQIRILSLATNPTGQLVRQGETLDAEVEIGLNRFLEIGVNKHQLRFVDEMKIEFCVEVIRGGHVADHVPREGLISLEVPSKTDALYHWQI